MKKIFLSTLAAVLFFMACDKADVGASFSTGGTTGAGGSTARFAINGNYLYTVDAQILRVYNISNAADPVLKSTQQVGFEIETIFPFNGKLFIGSTSVVHIFSLDNPEQPVKLSQAISPSVMRRCDPVVAKDTVAFATLRTNSFCGGTRSILAVYDIKDVTKPVEKASFDLSEPYGLGYADTVLYVCDKPGLTLINIKKAYQPTFIKLIGGNEYYDVIPYNGLLFCWVKNGMIVYNIANPGNPVKLSEIH